MNKKFSTLVAAALLATSFGAVNAQIASTDSIPYVNGKYYVLAGGANGVAAEADSVLSVTQDGGKFFLSLSSSRAQSLAEVDSALWQATITTKPGASAPTFQFINKATGMPLAIDAAKASKKGVNALTDSLAIGGSVTEWKHSSVLKNPIRSTLSAALDGDSSVVLGVTTSGNHVIAYRAGNNEVNDAPNSGLNYSALKLQVFAASPVYLNAADLNTMMWRATDAKAFKEGWFKLNYNPALVGSVNEPNIFDQQLQAVPAVTSVNDNAYTKTVTGSDSIYLKVKGKKVKDVQAFAMLDTAYFNLSQASDTLGNKYRRFVYADTTKAAIGNIDTRSLPQFAFKFRYYPSQDSIAIYTSSAAKRQIANDGSTYWKDNNASISGIDTLVKVATLVREKHSEFTVGSDLNAQGVASANAAGVRFNFAAKSSDIASIPSGYYFIKNLNDDSAVLSDKKKDYYYTIGVDSVLTYLPDGNKDWMTASQWYFNTNSNFSTVSNREFTEPKTYSGAPSGLFYKGADYSATNLVVTDLAGNKLKFEPVTDLTKSGYYTELEVDAAVEKKAYALKYFTGFDAISAYVNVKADSALNVKESEKAGQFFELVRVKHNDAEGKEKELDTYTTVKDAAGKPVNPLTRAVYKVRVKTSLSDVNPDYQYVVLDGNKYKVSAKSGGAEVNAARFYLKKTTKEEYFALIDTTTISGKTVKGNASKVVVSDATSSVNDLEYIALSGRTSSFALTEELAPLYRRLGGTDKEDGFADLKVDTAKIFVVSNPNRFLNENSVNKIAGSGKEEGLNYLGEFNISQFPKSTSAIFIDTAYVRNETKRPQYLLALRPTFNHAKPCPDDETHPVTGEESVVADYLVNLADSLATQPKAKFETYTRLAFVPAKHIKDALIINNSKFTGKTTDSQDTISFAKNEFNKAAFQFRLVKEGSTDFLIESLKGEYVKIHNGVPVLTKNIADAEVFNLSKTTDLPTDNETIGTTVVSVIAGNGQVVINNAAGKTVAISNILGQTIAQTVLTSDNATISVPAGIVVVAVEGEAAVKAIVK